MEAGTRLSFEGRAAAAQRVGGPWPRFHCLMEAGKLPKKASAGKYFMAATLRLVAPRFAQWSGCADPKCADNLEAFLGWSFNHGDAELSTQICNFIGLLVDVTLSADFEQYKIVCPAPNWGTWDEWARLRTFMVHKHRGGSVESFTTQLRKIRGGEHQ